MEGHPRHVECDCRVAFSYLGCQQHPRHEECDPVVTFFASRRCRDTPDTMHLPLRDSSSASRPVSRTASHHGPIFRLPSHSIPWLPGLPPPSRDIPQCLARSAQHPPWHPPHRYVFRLTTAHSGHTASLPPLCHTTASPATPLCLPAAPLS